MAAETRADYYAFTAPRRCRTPLLLRDVHLGEYLGDMCRRYMLDRPLNERRAGSKWILVYTRSCLEYGMSQSSAQVCMVISTTFHGHQRNFAWLSARVCMVISASLHVHQREFAQQSAQACTAISASLHSNQRKFAHVAGTLKWRLLVANDRDELDRKLRRHCDTSRCANEQLCMS